MKQRLSVFILFVLMLSLARTTLAAAPWFPNAPPSADRMKNPYAGQAEAVKAGAAIYQQNCSACHGANGEGTGNIPSLRSGPTQAAPEGQVFWFVTTGSVSNGMPSWEGRLSQQQRWEVVTFLKALGSVAAAPSPIAPAGTAVLNAPPPTAPFTDFRYEKPGTVRYISVDDLPPPYQTKSAGNGPRLVARPANAWPIAPAGFTVQQFATHLKNPRLLQTAPSGDVFLAESGAGDIRVFRGLTSAGQAERSELFATGLEQPYGIAFYPPGPHPQFVYIGDTDEIVRYPYQDGDLQARGPRQHIAGLPHGRGHWTRAIQFSADGQKLYVGVGSVSNVDDPDTTPGEKDRADILEFNPDGSGMRVYAYGIRNAGGGLAIHPRTGQLWCSVNERDGLGDNLVPDYITHLERGGFYGWPWWYLGGNQDPRHVGKHAELKQQVIVPDVLIQPHNASLQLTFYAGKQFPREYVGDIFASQHGSWNRSVRTGYEVIRVRMDRSGRATGKYEDFLTGFVLEDGTVWGRPVGVTVAHDGSLLISDDGSNSIWRVAYR